MLLPNTWLFAYALVTILKTVSDLEVKNGELMPTTVSCLFQTSIPGHNFKKSRKLFEERKGVIN